MATTFYKHDNKVIGFQNKVVSAPTAVPSLAEFTINTTASPQDFTFYLNTPSNLVVEWGDGTSDDTFTTTGNKTHSYASAGDHTLKIKSGTAVRVAFGASSCTPLRLKAVTQAISASLGVTSAQDMFKGCNNCTSWATAFFDSASANITNMSDTLNGCTTFNESVSGWNTAKVTTMLGTFGSCAAFNQSLANFDTAKVTNMNYLLSGCSVFNGSVANFNTANVTEMKYMFEVCKVFNQSVASFNTAKVTTMQSTFSDCWAFNQDVSNFNTANVTNISSMFWGCKVFNQSVASFNTAKVTTMGGIFRGCSVFNQDVSTFNTALVQSMQEMFQDCTAFNQDVSGWTVTALTGASNMLYHSAFAKTNYDLLLVAWAAQAVQNSVTFHAGTAHYSAGDPATAHDHLTGTHSWTITDGGTP